MLLSAPVDLATATVIAIAGAATDTFTTTELIPHSHKTK
ncbi:hypothetical protein SALWKB2_0383 [Snodgrassella alvi wkB2]|nr:hypothetical protein SALWKB2_0383 [Snodgrassella alvi wkB2]